MKKRYALVFGGHGQDGYYLGKLLEGEGITPLLLNRQTGDVSDFLKVMQIVGAVQPAYIFHLAATSSTDHAHLFANQGAIVDGTTHILESVKAHCPDCKVFISGSILQFDDTNPIHHLKSLFTYQSAYAAQRHASVAIGRYYRTIGLQVYIGYFGHHDSPRRSEKHLAMRIAQAAKLDLEQIILKNPMDRKEWNYAGDFMAAVWMLVNSPVYEAVIGAGKTSTIASFAELCLGQAGYSGPQRWVADWTRTEPKVTVTDPSIIASIGWKPVVSVQELAEMMVQ